MVKSAFSNNKNKELFKSLINASPDIIYIYNLTWDVFLYVNERVENILGYTEFELKEFSDTAYSNLFEEQYFKKYQSEIKPQLQQAIDNQVIEYTFKVKHKNGSSKWLYFRDVVIERKKNGEPRQVLGIAQDVTKRIEQQEALIKANEELKAEIESRKKMEHMLKEKERKYRRLFDNAPIGMYHSDFKGKIQTVNSALLNMLGYDSLQQLSESKKKSNLYADSNSERTINKILKDEGVIYNYETEMIRADGKTITIKESANLVSKNGNGALLCEGIIQDITEQKVNEKELKILMRGIENAPVSIVITDSKGIIEFVNPKYVESSKYSVNELVGQPTNILKSGVHDDNFYNEMWNKLNSGHTWEGEFINKNKEGKKFWEKAIISPVKNEYGSITHFIAVKEDISEKKDIMSELISAKEKAENSDKLKTEFLAQISHEIRTPLNSLICFSEFLSSELKEEVDDDLKSAFNAIEKSGSRIIRTIDLILNVSQIQSNSYDYYPQKLDLWEEIVKPVYETNKIIASSKNIELKIMEAAFPIKVEADKYSLIQVFSNLIDNAIKFTDAGSIDIVYEWNKENEIVVKVIDTGIGIDEDYLPKIFEKFSQEEQGYTRKYEGNGLGLCLVNEYCKLNNIMIDVDSKKNAGTSILLTFKNSTDNYLLNE